MSRAYRIEKYLTPEQESSVVNDKQDKRHDEVIALLNGIKKSIDAGVTVNSGDAAPVAHEQINQEIINKQVELIRLKDEMRAIYKAIDDTKCQILTIKESGTEGHEMARAAEELSMIVKGTEEATNTILHAAENVETNAANLIAAIRDESQQAMACEIQEQIVSIFEACNFQDLTGQRITKVVKTFCFIEARILKMIEIWGGPENFMNITPEELECRQGDKGMLNGPSLETEGDVVNQDDIDALFD